MREKGWNLFSIYKQPIHRNVKWFRGELVFKAHCVSLNSRLESDEEEAAPWPAPNDHHVGRLCGLKLFGFI